MIARDIWRYLSRDWDAARAAKDQYWAHRIERLGPLEGLRIAGELRRQMLAQNPGWPTSEERRDDLAAHAELAARLRRADRPRRS